MIFHELTLKDHLITFDNVNGVNETKKIIKKSYSFRHVDTSRERAVVKVTISVCKVYKNSGSLRFHRKKTPKHWKHYFIDDETGDWKFNTEWVNPITAQFLKRKKHHKITFICLNCARRFLAYVKNSRQKVYCPVCPDDE